MKTLKFKTILLTALLYSGCLSASGWINDAMVFSIEKGGKTSYIMGAFHTVGLEEFSPMMQSLLLNQDKIVIEHGSGMSFNKSMFKRDARDAPWMHLLSPMAQQYMMEKARFTKDVGALKLWAAFMAAVTSDFKGMDSQLADIYKASGRPLATLEDNNPREIAVTYQYLVNSTVGRDLITEIERAAYYHYSGMPSPEKIDEEHMKMGYRFGQSLWNSRPGELDILAARNAIWIPNIEEIHHTSPGSVLFAVGVGHLPHRTGVLRLLENAGYVIKKVDNNGYFTPFSAFRAWG